MLPAAQRASSPGSGCGFRTVGPRWVGQHRRVTAAPITPCAQLTLSWGALAVCRALFSAPQVHAHPALSQCCGDHCLLQMWTWAAGRGKWCAQGHSEGQGRARSKPGSLASECLSLHPGAKQGTPGDVGHGWRVSGYHPALPTWIRLAFGHSLEKQAQTLRKWIRNSLPFLSRGTSLQTTGVFRQEAAAPGDKRPLPCGDRHRGQFALLPVAESRGCAFNPRNW